MAARVAEGKAEAGWGCGGEGGCGCCGVKAAAVKGGGELSNLEAEGRVTATVAGARATALRATARIQHGLKYHWIL